MEKQSASEVLAPEAEVAAAEVAATGFFGHPRGLATLFFTELWERFSYYGMRALLILFMTNAATGLGMGEAQAGTIYGLYTFAVYVLALPGGWIADRLVGQRRAVLIGGVIIALGHYVLAIPAVPTFYLGLCLVATGTGLLKPNVSAIVGDLYADKGARRDAGFSIFYMGINIGAFLGPMICSYVGEPRQGADWVNWHYGFGAAGVGMTFAVIQYVLGGKYLGNAGELKPEHRTPEALADARRKFGRGLGVVAILAAVIVGLSVAEILPITLVGSGVTVGAVVSVLAVFYFAYIIAFACHDVTERKRVALIFLLFVGAAFFWSGFEQAGSTMNLFAKEQTRRVFFDWEMPAGWLQQVNPLLIIILAPVMGMLWVRLGARSPSLGMKFAIGLLLLGSGFFVMAWGSSFVDEGLVSPMWLVVTYFFHTVGELCLSPVGLSGITKLSPHRLVGQMMGTWFMGAALGNLMAGLVTGYLETMAQEQLFRTVALIAVGAGLVFVILSPLIRRLAGGIR